MPTNLQAVIFDMDGTITKPVIDWHALRSAIGAPPERTIMDHISSLPQPDRDCANDILLETELRATDNVELNDGFCDLHREIQIRGLKTAVVTNNHGAALQNLLAQHELTFDVALSRDDGALKPAPDLIQKALDHLGCNPKNALGVGDSQLDVTACAKLNVTCLYLTHGNPQFEHHPSIVSLREAITYL
jgi:HAD superfamily hydrolase (TIGR01509 family)